MALCLISYSQEEKKSPAVFILNFRIQIQTQICAELYILLSTIQDQNSLSF